MPFCTCCGIEVSSDDYECPNCHAKLKDEPKRRFCQNCGKELSPEASFCPDCGCRADSAPKKERPRNKLGDEITGERSALIGIILSAIITGLGTIYAGYAKDGIILIVLMIACFILGFFFFFPWLVSVAIWFYGIYDAYKKCEENNRLWYRYQDSL